MNREETIMLFLKNIKEPGAWNKWAEEMLNKKKELKKVGKWKIYKEERFFNSKSPEVQEVQKWLDDAFVDFSCITFSDIKVYKNDELEASNLLDSILESSEDVSHSYFFEIVFPDNVFFNKTVFEDTVSFEKSYIHGNLVFDEAIFQQSCWFEGTFFKGNASFKNVRFEGCAWYSNATFKKESNFENSIFQGLAEFTHVDFRYNTSFQSAIFYDIARFIKSKFIGTATFCRTLFQDDVWFEDVAFKGIGCSYVCVDFSLAKLSSLGVFVGAKFHKKAIFEKTIFKNGSFENATFNSHALFLGASFLTSANFDQTKFNDYTNYMNCHFYGEASFIAIQVSRSFQLQEAMFYNKIPDFTQSNFSNAPRLDYLKIIPTIKFSSPYSWKRYFWQEKTLPQMARFCKRMIKKYPIYQLNKFFNERRDKNEEAYHRALKHLAIQGHDHKNEMKFFAGEIRSRRHITDFVFPWVKGFGSSSRYWAGVFYELTSNFGRSMIRPLISLIILFALFTSIYPIYANLKAIEICQKSKVISPATAARTITAKNSFLFIGMDRSEKLKRAYTCLYGASPVYDKSFAPEAKPVLAPNVPGWVSFWGALNTVLSMGLIFLFFLALRNQFKIK